MSRMFTQMNRIWFGIFLRHFQDPFRFFVGSLQDLCRIFSVSLQHCTQEMSRIFTQTNRIGFRIFLRHFQDLFRIFTGFLQDFYRIFTGFFRDRHCIQGVSRIFAQINRILYRITCRISSRIFSGSLQDLFRIFSTLYPGVSRIFAKINRIWFWFIFRISCGIFSGSFRIFPALYPGVSRILKQMHWFRIRFRIWFRIFFPMRPDSDREFFWSRIFLESFQDLSKKIVLQFDPASFPGCYSGPYSGSFQDLCRLGFPRDYSSRIIPRSCQNRIHNVSGSSPHMIIPPKQKLSKIIGRISLPPSRIYQGDPHQQSFQDRHPDTFHWNPPTIIVETAVNDRRINPESSPSSPLLLPLLLLLLLLSIADSIIDWRWFIRIGYGRIDGATYSPPSLPPPPPPPPRLSISPSLFSLR